MLKASSSVTKCFRFRAFSAVAFSGAVLAACGCSTTSVAVGSGAAATQAKAVPAGPQLGYAWKADDETLRPILGVSGSSQIGESVVSAGSYVAGAGSTASGYALLVGTDQQVYRMALPTGTASQINVTAASGSKVRFSPSGISAVLFVPGGTTATLVTGISTTPQARQLTVSGALADLTASDDGTVVASLATSKGVAIELVTAAGALQQLALPAGAGGLSFVGKTDDLLVGDASANTLTLIHSVANGASATPVATGGLLKGPVAVGAAMNGRYAIVANSAESSVVRVDLTGVTAPQKITCPVQPTVVEQLAGAGTFRFSEIGANPAWTSDITAASPAMLFIPALPKAASPAAGS